MKITYDSKNDVMDIWFKSGPIAKNEGKPGMLMDYHNSRNLVHIMIMDASKRIDTPKSLSYSIID
jgi:uncharacterized protein YuzE